MTQDNLSRRGFFHTVAAGSTGAALTSLPGSAATTPGALPGPPSPVLVESYPIVEAGRGASLDRVKIATRGGIPDSAQEKIRALSRAMEVKTCGSPEEFRREVADTHIIYGGVTREDFAAAKQLRWIQFGAAGVETLMWPELIESPVVLTNMQRVYAPAISETAIGLMLTLTRGLNGYAHQTREHQWKAIPGLVEISGMTMGLVGLGGIGTETAYRAHYGFNMRILAVDPKPLPKPDFVAELRSLDWLPQMVPQVDVLVCAAPHTKLSEGMLNESVFRAMKSTAYFINLSRGKLVNTPDLIRALKEGWISGAGLDVAYKEPLPPDDPLWTAGNIIITSHSSGHSPRTIDRQMAVFTENVRRYLAGLPLLNVVDKKRGY